MKVCPDYVTGTVDEPVPFKVPISPATNVSQQTPTDDLFFD